MRHDLMRALLLLLLGSAMAGCAQPGGLRNPRNVGPQGQAMRGWLGATHAASRVDSPGRRVEGSYQVYEAGFRIAQGFEEAWDLEYGARFQNLDLGLELGGKWQFLGVAQPRAPAAALSLELSTRLVLLPSRASLNLLGALPIASSDLVFGVGFGYVFGEAGPSKIDSAASPSGHLPPGGVSLLAQAGWQADPRRSVVPYFGVQASQDLQPLRRYDGPVGLTEWTWAPVLRLELGVQFDLAAKKSQEK